MAAGTLESPDLIATAPKVTKARRAGELAIVMKAFSSLKLTVALFAYGIFVVLVGTLAQTEMDIWQVVPDYFRSVIMWVDVNLFFPDAFFPQMPHLNVPLIPLPGGMVVGVLMLLNLAAAHSWRFQIQAKGMRLLWGMAALALAIVITTAIIVSGNLGTGIQAKPLLAPSEIWFLFCGLLVAAWFASTFFIAQYAWREGSGLRQSGWLVGYFRLRLLFLALGAYLSWSALVVMMVSGYLAPPTESMRILWQLLQGGLAGVLLLAACYVLFAKRAGVVLLHAGVALMMISELVVARYAIEWQLMLEEGQASNYVRDIRTTELAIIDRSAPEGESVVVIPQNLVEANAKKNEQLAEAGKPPVPIRDDEKTHELLPFDVTVVKHYRNHDLRPLKTGEKTLATTGAGLKETAVERRPATGTEGSRVDTGAAYVKLTEKKAKGDLGTYLVSQIVEHQPNPEAFAEVVEVDGKKYEMYLRFERAYKPYTVKLIDVRKDDYLGSDTPKNYSSDVQLNDPESGIDSKIHIKMNDPLRYRGDTFYQSNYSRQPDGRETTTLAVVNNVGWMIPYVACMIVVTGLVFQFSIALQRFINRRAQEESGATASSQVFQATLAEQPKKPARTPPAQLAPSRSYTWEIAAVALAAAVAVMYIGSKLREKDVQSRGMNVSAFGRLPVVHEGRVKPIDTLARNTLRALSNYETANVERGGKKVQLSAVEWLLDVATQRDGAYDYRVIKVDHPDLIKFLELKPQPKNLYSLMQLFDNVEELTNMARDAAGKKEKDPGSLTTLERKAMELFQRIKLFDSLTESFTPPRMPPVPTQEEFQSDPALAQEKAFIFQRWMRTFPQEVRERGLPLLVPLANTGERTAEDAWIPYPLAAWEALRAQVQQEKTLPAAEHLAAMFTAYRDQKPGDFQRALEEYQSELRETSPRDYAEEKVGFEAYFNYVSPFYVGSALYVIALVIALGGWLFQSRPANLAAMTIIAVTLLWHTAALGARIYISGRPPVTNLYSSAVFIGWGCVLFCLVFEIVFLNGLGNVVGAMTGFAALLISYFLSVGGDTISVLQAVLDTQFWLATHVVCITLGYTATYLAGFFGLCYVILGICTPKLSTNMRAELARMIYGITCFAILLSFFGTVLGGLWADDSWGRFWGWDPKENGALIIVLWNALVLHAKWDKLVKDRGLALLAIAGNIVTSWSWFGVNELGVGLHSYGFTEGVLRALGTFALYMLACILFGLVPVRLWWSENRTKPTELSGPLGVTFAMVNVVFLLAFSYFAMQYLA
jgi:ABC-type transport system involved in cytochrome c biogenesis permease subunit